MEDLEILRKIQKKRACWGAIIGVSSGALLGFTQRVFMQLGDIVDPFVLYGMLYLISFPARAFCYLTGREFYPDGFRSELLIGITDAIILGLMGAFCGFFLIKSRRAL